jgi:hypothetical protein
MRAKQIEAKIWEALYRESNKICKFPNEDINTRSYKCSVQDCQRNAYSAGLCNAHSLRKKKGKRLDIPIKNRKSPSVICIDCGDPTDKHGSGLSRCPKHFKSHRAKTIKDAIVYCFGNKCSLCGYTYPGYVYDLHHNNGGKEKGVGTLVTNASIKRIAQEASKCVLICANCHRGIHYAR